LYGTLHPQFDEFYEKHGYAETWARLLAEVRSRAAAPAEPTEAQVEAAAKAMYELRAKIDDPFWEGGKLDYGIKQIYRQDARAALVAAAALGLTAEQEGEQR